MKKFFRFAAAAVAAFAIFSCEKTPDTPTPDGPDTPGNTDEPKVEYTENIEFTLEVVEVEADAAKVKVSHNGTRTDNWTYFATTETDIVEAIEAKVEDILANGATLEKNTSKTVTVRDLETETKYTFVAFAITTEGDVYGTYKTVEFTTAAAPLEGFQVNPAWTVEYLGEGVADDGKSYDHVISVTSTDNNPYLTSVFTKAEFEQYGIEAVAENEIAYWTEYVNAFNQANGTNYDISALLYTGNAKEGWDLDAGEFVALAIGVNEDGEASGYYAVSEPFSIVEAEMSEAYKAWLGDWTFTGANGLSQTVTFSKDSANKTFSMTGYEGKNIAVTVDWFEEQQCWQIYNQKIGTYNFDGGEKGDVWFLGEDVEGHLFLSELPICVGGMSEDGTLVCLPFEGELEMQGGSIFNYAVNDMLYIAYFGGEDLGYISNTFETGYPTFPMTITPAASTSAVVKDTAKKSSKNTMLPTPFKAYDFNKSAKVRF